MGFFRFILGTLTFCSAAGLLALAYLCYRQRARSATGQRTGVILTILLLTAAWWAVASGMVNVRDDLPGALAWLRLSFIGIIPAPLLMLAFILSYTRRNRFFSFPWLTLALVIPAILVTAALTNPWHHLFFDSESISWIYGNAILRLTRGPLFWASIGYGYLVMLASVLLLIRALNFITGPLRRPLWLILGGTLAPWLVNIIVLVHDSAWPIVDITPIAFTVTGLTIYLAVFQLRMLAIVPIARRALIENMQDGVLVTDMECRVLDLNPEVASWLGIKPGQVIGAPLSSILQEPFTHRTVDQKDDWAVLEVEIPHQGQLRTVEVHISTIYDGEQAEIGMLLLLRDITARKRLEKDLEEARVLLEQAFNQSPVPMVLLRSSDLVIEMINPACRETMKLTNADTLIGQKYEEGRLTWEVRDLEGRILPFERRPLSLALDGSALSNAEYMLRFLDGSLRWVLVNATPILNKTGEQIAVLLVFVDITGRKQIEQAEREQRFLAEAFRDTAAILNSTIDLDTVLTLVLTNIERVVPHDAASVILFDGEGKVSLIRSRGYISDEQQRVTDLCRKVTEASGWQEGVHQPQALILADVNQTDEWAEREGFLRLRAFLIAPVRFKESVIGLITLSSAVPGFYSMVHAGRLQVFADQSAMAMENARLYQEVQNLTLIDELTQVHNYRGLMDLGQREYDRALRFNRPLAVLFFDIDHFRDFNNRYGHMVGNQVLQTVAQKVHSCLRGVDLLARYGGEEFVILLPEMGLSQALEMADQLRQEVAQTTVTTRYGQVGITISIGAAELSEKTHSLIALIDRANQAEQHAKSNGRNRVSGTPVIR